MHLTREKVGAGVGVEKYWKYDLIFSSHSHSH